MWGDLGIRKYYNYENRSDVLTTIDIEVKRIIRMQNVIKTQYLKIFY